MRRVAFGLMMMALVPVLGLVACGGGDEGTDDGSELTGKPEDDGKVVDGKADAWNSTNNPSRFQLNLIYNYDQLKQYTVGRAAQIPWPSHYWSYYEDSTNDRFHGASVLSPTEKYDKAFNNWSPDMSLAPMDVSAACNNGLITEKQDNYYTKLGPASKWQHQNKGNYAARNGKDDDADGKIDECGDDYDGIETWWGLCHAWAPAAILEPEPLHPVTVNGVEFSVQDIKALLITMYDRSSSLMLGGRCNEKEVKRDAQGRLTQDECRDTNAGAFHVIITNMLGKDKRAFAEDRTADYQVWNQPVLGYRIVTEKVMTEEEAMTKLGQPGKKYKDTFNSPEAVAWRYVKMDVDYITESAKTAEGPLTPSISQYTRTDKYEYIVELKANGDVVGGEWIGYSQATHPDFLWLPISTYGGNPSMSLSQVRNLLELSRKTETSGGGNETFKEYGGAADVAIPDNKSTGVEHKITVPDDVKIGSLKLKLDVTHTYIGDLKITLTKGDKTIVLHDKQGGGADNIAQSYSVADFNGLSAKGDWIVKIVDTAAQDVGKLTNATLYISSASTSPNTTKTWSSTAAAAIPDNNKTGISSVIKVPDEGSIKAFKVTVDITHTYVGDLTVRLERGGQKQVLHAREGGSADDIKKSFSLTSFNGAPVSGDWTLVVVDEAGQDVGTLNSWTIEAQL